MDYYEMAEKLEDFSQEVQDEAGEVWGLLASLLHYPDYVSDEFKAALHKEAAETLKFIDENYEWIEEEYTVPAQTKKRKEFQYKY